jgi:hypothetical protein
MDNEESSSSCSASLFYVSLRDCSLIHSSFLFALLLQQFPPHSVFLWLESTTRLLPSRGLNLKPHRKELHGTQSKRKLIGQQTLVKENDKNTAACSGRKSIYTKSQEKGFIYCLRCLLRLLVVLGLRRPANFLSHLLLDRPRVHLHLLALLKRFVYAV